MSNGDMYGVSDLVERLRLILSRVGPDESPTIVSASADEGFDARMEWRIHDASLPLSVEIKLIPLRTREAIRRIADATRAPRDHPLLLAPYISPAARDELAVRGWSYADATGNLLVQSADPLVWVRESGAQREPGGAPDVERKKLRSLKGRATSELIVHLLTHQGSTSVRELSRDTGVSVATASRVVELLREEELLRDTNGGAIKLRDSMATAERWALDYGFAKTFGAARYFSLAGDSIALERIRNSGVRYALTGAQAASHYLGSQGRVSPLPSNETWLYTEDLKAIERIADLVPDARSGTIVVAEADFFAREGFSDGSTPTVRPWRTAGDLLSAGGRLSMVGETLGRTLARERIPI